MSIIGPIVAGHQPNFFPWFGYFEKMLKSDVFVFSDDVQYPKQCYVNRVEVPVGKSSGYLTLPVKKGGDLRIADKKYLNDKATLKKLLKTIKINLGGSRNYSDISEIVDEFESVFTKFASLADLNRHMILLIAKRIGINTKTMTGTELGLEEYHRNQRLIKRCQLLDSRIYLCGQGAVAYQDEEVFSREQVELRYIEYDIGKRLFGSDLQYSILHVLAKYGTSQIRQTVHDYQNSKKSLN